MAPQVEANSLSDITQLASNPPKYPRNPTEKQRQPLTLYIARVPGTRDVILTTLKPQLKNVTAEDVASSLYYFHLNSDDDAQLLAQDSSLILEEEEPIETKGKPLPRKPLSESARSPTDINHSLPEVPQQVSRPMFPEKLNRKALSPEAQTSTQPQVHLQGRMERKPLGPRPLLTDASTTKQPPRGIVETRPLTVGGEVPNFASVPNISIHTRDSSHNHFQQNAMNSSLRAMRSFSITIIRRDLSSGAQWNIGTLLGEEQNILENSSQSKKPFFDISIQLTTPGYARFRKPQTNGIGKDGSSSNVSSQDRSLVSEGGFDRQIRMEGSSFWSRPKHKRLQSGYLDNRDSSRRGSASTDSTSPRDAKDQIYSPDGGPKGYVFGSPWGGRCKFSTSSSGRSLKCKHTLPGAISTNNIPETGSSSQYVSELRFNLPSLNVFSTERSPTKSQDGMASSSRFHIPKFGHIRNKISPDKILHPSIPPRPHPTSYASLYPSDDEDAFPPHQLRPFSNPYGADTSGNDASSGEDTGRLDLSIGQEKAGGGNRGKRVKLGKLIIFDEGFKMLDLVVAANIGIWWSVWESNS